MSKDDFWEVIQSIRPDWTKESFDLEWERFIQDRDSWRKDNYSEAEQITLTLRLN